MTWWHRFFNLHETFLILSHNRSCLQILLEWGRLSRAICICSFIGLDDFLDFYCTLSTLAISSLSLPLSFLFFLSVLFVSSTCKQPFPVCVMGHTCAEFLVMFYLIRSFIIRSSLFPSLSLYPLKYFLMHYIFHWPIFTFWIWARSAPFSMPRGLVKVS